MLWRATEGIIENSSYVPNEWDYNDETEQNNNPWVAVYPWESGDIITLNTVKHYVDRDYWIADMSLLGKAIRDDDISSSTHDFLAEPKVVPNPYMVYSNQNNNSLRFIHLPRKCTITIYTISGEFVDIIEHDSEFDGEHTWDLKNKHGYNVAPGLYIYQVMHSDFYSYPIITPKFGASFNKPYSHENTGNANGIYKTGKFAIVK
jgi:hypothetical protein